MTGGWRDWSSDPRQVIADLNALLEAHDLEIYTFEGPEYDAENAREGLPIHYRLVHISTQLPAVMARIVKAKVNVEEDGCLALDPIDWPEQPECLGEKLQEAGFQPGDEVGVHLHSRPKKRPEEA